MKHSAAFFSLMLQWEDGKISFRGKGDERVRLNLREVARNTKIDASCMKVVLSGVYNIDGGACGINVKLHHMVFISINSKPLYLQTIAIPHPRGRLRLDK